MADADKHTGRTTDASPRVRSAGPVRRTDDPSSSPHPRRTSRWLARLLLVVMTVAVVCLSIKTLYYYRQSHNLGARTTANTSTATAQYTKAQTTKLLASVGKLIVLPTGEDPSIQTVADKDQLKAAPFFASAQNGDKVIVYTKANQAILYRESTNRIINVAPAYDTTKRYRVAVFDAADDSAAAKKIGATVTKVFSNVVVADTVTRINASVQGVTVVDLAGGNADTAAQIATSVDGTVGQLPRAVAAPADTDLVVVVGR